MRRTILLGTIAALLVFIISCTKEISKLNSDNAAANTSKQLATNVNAPKLPTTPFAIAYVEVNNDKVSNAGCYTAAGKPLFAAATIFAANIDSGVNGNTPLLYFNPQTLATVQSTQIATLHKEGVKVILSILGNHQQIGIANFASFAIADNFAQQCAAAVQKYNLDGIDIDDEYADYNYTNNNSTVWFFSALRNRLGESKIITYTVYGYLYDNFFQPSYNGKKVGDLIDLVIEDTYGSDPSGRMQEFINLGVAKSKIMIGSHLGWGDQGSVASFAK